jgi:hypothetical protein
MEEIYEILEKQKEDLQKKEKHHLEQTQKQVSKEKEFKTLSFNSVIARPPFIFAPKKKEFFDPSLPKTFIDTGKALNYFEKEALIYPDRILAKNLKNGKSFNIMKMF